MKTIIQFDSAMQMKKFAEKFIHIIFRGQREDTEMLAYGIEFDGLFKQVRLDGYGVEARELETMLNNLNLKYKWVR